MAEFHQGPWGELQAARDQHRKPKWYSEFNRLPGITQFLDWTTNLGMGVATYSLSAGGALVAGAAAEVGYAYCRRDDSLVVYGSIQGSAGAQIGGGGNFSMGIWKYENIEQFSGTGYTMRVEVGLTAGAARVYFSLPSCQLLGIEIGLGLEAEASASANISYTGVTPAERA